MNKENFRNHFYLRKMGKDGHLHPCGVVAFDEISEGLVIAASFCMPGDQWKTSFALNRAYGKLKSKEKRLVIPMDKCKEITLYSTLTNLGIPFGVYHGELDLKANRIFREHVKDMIK